LQNEKVGGKNMTIEFSVPGKPVPMARPRVTAHGTYTPKRCRDYKTAVAIAAKAAMVGKKQMEGAVACRIELYFNVPKSYACGKHLAAKHNVIKPVGRNTGDADNHAKAIMDALTGIVWRDDSQVTYLVVSKLYGSEDWAEISIRDDVRA
jgi:Holliday junction resolvase RusA-like endonuclease